MCCWPQLEVRESRSESVQVFKFCGLPRLVRIGHDVLRASLVGVLRASLVGVLQRASLLRSPGVLRVRLHWQASSSLLVRVGVLRALHWHSGWQVTVGVLRATESLVDVTVLLNDSLALA